MNYRMLMYTVGRILLIVGLTLFIPLFVSIYYHEEITVAYLIPIGISLLIGLPLSVITPANKNIYVREGFVIVAFSWILVSLIGGLPFFISHQIPSFIDCFFETVSGFTTTGATILNNVEGLSRSLLFWRSFTHWLGGMGILVLTMAIFSTKDTRTTHVMNAEMSGPSADKLTSKWQFSVRILYITYIVLTVAEVVFLLAGGMPLFDSLVHTFGTAGTGGFGIKNSSIAYYDSAYVDYVIAIFMMIFGVNLSIYYLIITRRFKTIVNNAELKWYLAIMLGVSVIIAVNIMPLYNTFGEAFRYSFFQTSSAMTTTGYSTADFARWPMLSQALILMVMFIGGCVGSTAGGLKVMRFMVLIKTAIQRIKKTVSPRRVMSLKINEKQLDPNFVSGIVAYFVVYIIFIGLSTLLVSLDNMDFTTTFTAVVASVNNIGPGLGAVGPTGNFGSFSILSKIVLSIDMLAGRLELYPILVLVLPSTWRRA